MTLTKVKIFLKISYYIYCVVYEVWQLQIKCSEWLPLAFEQHSAWCLMFCYVMTWHVSDWLIIFSSIPHGVFIFHIKKSSIAENFVTIPLFALKVSRKTLICTEAKHIEFMIKWEVWECEIALIDVIFLPQKFEKDQSRNTLYTKWKKKRSNVMEILQCVLLSGKLWTNCYAIIIQ